VRNFSEFSEEEFGRIFCGAKRRKKPGYPLQSFCPPLADKKDFRFYPLRAHGLGGGSKPAAKAFTAASYAIQHPATNCDTIELFRNLSF
jgi:hypothetical protein